MPRKALKQRADGRYSCRYKDKYFYGNTSEEAYSAREEYKRQLKSGLREESLGKTVTQYAKEWMSVYKANVSVRTYNDYAHYINLICNDIGDARMKDITPTDIQILYNNQIGKSKSYVHKYTMLAKSLFAAAVEDGIILRSPCTKAKPPKAEEGTHRALEQWERDLVASMVGKHDLAIAAMLMLYGGLRRGEAIAFDVDTDVDFVNNRIFVRKSVAFDSNQPRLKSTKSKAGVREVYLFSPLKAALQQASGLVLSKKDGTIMSDTAWRRKWSSFITAMETELNGCHKRWYGRTNAHKKALSNGEELAPWREVTIKSHDFRHSFCTMLWDAGVDIKTAMKWMGHSDEKMILRIYAHLSEEKEKAAYQAVGKLIDLSVRCQNGCRPKVKALQSNDK